MDRRFVFRRVRCIASLCSFVFLWAGNGRGGPPDSKCCEQGGPFDDVLHEARCFGIWEEGFTSTGSAMLAKASGKRLRDFGSFWICFLISSDPLDPSVDVFETGTVAPSTRP